ncbi:SKA3 protein, partial [Alopecoenas beccarii]|nr:SKA3 protein [Alopecoenas beccarii]
DYEDESPIRVLHDLHCEIRTLKEEVNASLGKSLSEKQEIQEFMKASEILMQRNAADLGKIRELFQKYGYKPHEEINSDSTASVQNKSDEEKADDVPPLPASMEKPLAPKDPLRNPQLSDFGLSRYAFSRPWSAEKGQHTTNTYQENSKNRTPLKPQTPCTLAKTPKCTLKMDDYECATPKLEQFGISEHTMCMNEDYTISLLRRTAQASQKGLDVKSLEVNGVKLSFSLFCLFCNIKLEVACGLIRAAETTEQVVTSKKHPSCLLVRRISMLLKKDDCEVPGLTPREIIVTPGLKTKVTAENTNWMASPMVLVFCTPDVKIHSRTNSTVLSRSPDTNELPLPSHAETPRVPDFETRWLKTEAKVVNSNYIRFHTLFTTKQFFKCQFGIEEKIELVTKKTVREDRIPFALSSDEYLKHFGDPSPPKLKHYDQLLNTPPPPETRIPDDVLQILSKYNNKVDSSKAKEMETKAGNARRYESDLTGYCNKENR